MADFVLNPAGLAELCKAAPMQAGLREVAQKMAVSANADAHAKNSGIAIEPYGAAVDVLDYTAVGVAFVRTTVGARNEAKNKSLSRQLH